MFSKILGKNKDESDASEHLLEISKKISKMNLTEMKSYVNNKIKDFELCETGLVAVMKRLVLEDEDVSKMYIQIDDMDSKKKKAFELVIAISTNNKVTLTVIELIQEFIEVYEEIIDSYDKEFKQIYKSRLNDAITNGIATVGKVSTINMKLRTNR